MSVPTFLQSRLVPFAISPTNDGITYKALVCKKLWGLTVTPATAEEATDCGYAVGTGAVKFTFNAEFQFNMTPNTGEISANDIMGYVNAGTTVGVLLQAASPYQTNYIRRGSALITNYAENAPQGSTIGCTVTFSGFGLIATV